jgi:hypothetical protein
MDNALVVRVRDRRLLDHGFDGQLIRFPALQVTLKAGPAAYQQGLGSPQLWFLSSRSETSPVPSGSGDPGLAHMNRGRGQKRSRPLRSRAANITFTF